MNKHLLLTGISLPCLLIVLSCGNPSPSPSETPSHSKQSNATAKKLPLFNDVDGLRSALSNNGMGELRKWRADGAAGWISSSDYYPFGNPSDVNGMENNLAYYLESDNENNVKTLKLILNINNANEKKEALISFASAIEDTFKSMELNPPAELLAMAEKPKEFSIDSADYKASLILEKSNIDTWKLVIESH